MFEQDFVAEWAGIHHFWAQRSGVEVESGVGDEDLCELFEDAFAVGGAVSFADVESGAIDVDLEGIVGEELAEFFVGATGFAGDSATGVGAVFDEVGRGLVLDFERTRE